MRVAGAATWPPQSAATFFKNQVGSFCKFAASSGDFGATDVTNWAQDAISLGSLGDLTFSFAEGNSTTADVGATCTATAEPGVSFRFVISKTSFFSAHHCCFMACSVSAISRPIAVFIASVGSGNA